MNVLSELRSLSANLKLDVFTVEFEIVAHLFINRRSGIEDIRRSVRGSPGAISYKVRDLVESGIVVRNISEVDGRASFYELSPFTRDLLDAVVFQRMEEQRPARAA